LIPRGCQICTPTNADIPLSRTAARLARRLWRPGFTFRRIGVMALDLTDEHRHPGLWTETSSHVGEDDAVAAAVDAITRRFGRGAIGVGRAGLRNTPPWAMRQQRLTPAWTTDWKQLAHVY
jgi:DNA polymerase V